MEKKRVGFALTGSFCTFEQVAAQMQRMAENGWELFPVMSFHAYELDTRFGTAEHWRKRVQDICGREIIHTIQQAEPIGPKGLFDLLVVAPCTGNTLAKLAGGIADTPVTMAAKSHLRNGRPVLLAVSTNDALAGAARNIGQLMAGRHFYFVPMGQDAPAQKPRSVVADFSQIEAAAVAALEGRQLQPIYQAG